MTYDPRNGSSPYLGMDVSTEDDLMSAEEPRRPEVRRQERQRQEVRESVPAGAPDATPKTIRRPSQVPQARPVSPAPAQIRRPAPAAAPVAVPSPSQEPYRPSRPRGGGRISRAGSRAASWAASVALSLLALVLRLAAIALAALVCVGVVASGSVRVALVQAVGRLSVLVPGVLAGRFVYETPFGGVLRGDLACMAVILLVADWACVRYAASLREHPREV